MICRFEEEALAEYREGALYAEENYRLGEAFVQAVENALCEIAKSPTRYQAVGDGVRIFRLRRFPYYLYYLHHAPTRSITIYAVAHHKRERDYWRKRLG